MTTIAIEVGDLAATRQAWRTRSVRDAIIELLASNPQSSEEELLPKYVNLLRDNDDDLEAAASYALHAALKSIRARSLTAKAKADAALRRARSAKEYAEAAERHAQMVARIKGNILANTKMMNGKLLKNCTGIECRHFGGWFAMIADKIAPTDIVGQKLNDDALRELYVSAI